MPIPLLTAREFSDSYIYTVSATRRILGLDPNTRIEVIKLQKVIWVHVPGKRPTFISKKKYLQNFADYRRQSSHNVKITQVRNLEWRALASDKIRDYTVKLGITNTCNCGDYRIQEAAKVKHPCCKHIYAALNQLGYSSLKDFINAPIAA